MCKIYPVNPIFVVCGSYSRFRQWADRATITYDLVGSKIHFLDRLEKVLGIEIAPEQLVILDRPVNFDLNYLRCRIHKPSKYGETFETRFMWYDQPKDEVCLFVGGPWDGRKELIRSDLEYFRVPIFPGNHVFNPSTGVCNKSVEIATYVRQKLYEHDKKPFSIFYYEDGEGWLKKLVNGYKPGYGNFEPDIF